MHRDNSGSFTLTHTTSISRVPFCHILLCELCMQIINIFFRIFFFLLLYHRITLLRLRPSIRLLSRSPASSHTIQTLTTKIVKGCNLLFSSHHFLTKIQHHLINILSLFSRNLCNHNWLLGL